MGMLEKVQALLTLTGQAGGGGGGGGGGDITVDSSLSDTSTNPVQNKVIKTALDDKADQIIFPCGVSIGSDEEKGSAIDESQINIGKGSRVWGQNSIAIGHNAKAMAPVAIVIGKDSLIKSGLGETPVRGVIVGIENYVGYVDGVAIGAGHSLTEEGEIAIGAGDNMAEGYEASATAKANTIRVKGGVLTVGGKVIGGGGGGTVDTALSNTSTNPIQNQWLGKRMGATSSNSVQIGYGAKAGKTNGQEIDGSDGDNGYQVAVGRGANGSRFGAAFGCNAIGCDYGAAFGRNADGRSYGTAVGNSAYGSGEGTIAIGYGANAMVSGSAVFGARVTNAEPYSTKVSAYNKNTGSLLSVRIVTGSSAESSYFDFYHEDTLSGTVTGRRISAANFFSMLDDHGATTDIPNPGGGGGGGCGC